MEYYNLGLQGVNSAFGPFDPFTRQGAGYAPLCAGPYYSLMLTEFPNDPYSLRPNDPCALWPFIPYVRACQRALWSRPLAIREYGSLPLSRCNPISL